MRPQPSDQRPQIAINKRNYCAIFGTFWIHFCACVCVNLWTCMCVWQPSFALKKKKPNTQTREKAATTQLLQPNINHKWRAAAYATHKWASSANERKSEKLLAEVEVSGNSNRFRSPLFPFPFPIPLRFVNSSSASSSSQSLSLSSASFSGSKTFRAVYLANEFVLFFLSRCVRLLLSFCVYFVSELLHG